MQQRCSIYDNDWIRMRTQDGRIYFANRATGCSQWSMPTELYRSQRVKFHGVGESLLMPSAAKALAGVDCVTNVRGIASASLIEDLIEQASLLLLDTHGLLRKRSSLHLPTYQDVLQVQIISARGLRNADLFSDISDPFASCTFVGKEEKGSLRTQVTKNTLNPVWNYIGHLTNFDLGETLKFTVWDSDDSNPNIKNNVLTNLLGASGLDDGDDTIGAVDVTVHSNNCDGIPREYELIDNQQKKGADPSFITLAFSLLSWPVINGVITDPSAQGQ